MTKEMMEIEYNRARRLLETNDYEKIIEAKRIFTDLGDYSNSMKYLEDANSKINIYESEIEEKTEEKYNRALELLEGTKTAQKLDQAIKLFKELDDYKDSKEKLKYATRKREIIREKDKKSLDRLKFAGYLCVGIGIIVIAFLILAVIWSIVSNGGTE